MNQEPKHIKSTQLKLNTKKTGASSLYAFLPIFASLIIILIISQTI